MRKPLGLSILLSIVLAAVTFGQSSNATVSGTVTDSTGAVVPQASVQLRHVETGTARTVATDVRGWYRAATLAVGPYEIGRASCRERV